MNIQIRSKSFKKFLIFVAVITVLQFGIRYAFFSHSTPGFYIFKGGHKQHLQNLDLDIDQVKWFRIWYADGYKSTPFGDKYGYYAVSGGLKKMRRCDIYSDLKSILDTLSTINYSSMDDYDQDTLMIADDEYVSIRLKFKNEPYSKMGEFNLHNYFSMDTSSNSSRQNYIMLFHSQSTRYLIDKRDHPELVKLLEHLIFREYGDCMEFRTM